MKTMKTVATVRPTVATLNNETETLKAEVLALKEMIMQMMHQQQQTVAPVVEAPAVQAIQTVQTVPAVPSKTWSNRILNATEKGIVKSIQFVEPKASYVEERAVPYTAKGVAVGLDYTAKSTNWIGEMLGAAAKKTNAFADTHMPASAKAAVVVEADGSVTVKTTAEKAAKLEALLAAL